MTVSFDDVREHLDLEFYVDRESIPHKMGRGRSGMQINVGECPACGDTRYRVYLNADTGQGNCFVCNETFNKAKFVKLHQNLSWPETLALCGQIMKEQGYRPKRTATVAVDDAQVKLPTSYPLPGPEGNHPYLENRGIDGELARYFGLRFCEDGWWRFLKDDGTPGGQNFGQRVIIPVYDLDGTLVSFQGRDITGESSEKYRFPKGLPGTGRYLLNGQNAILTKRVVMGEGAMDVAAIKAALDEEVQLRDVVPVGSFGKHLSYGADDGNDQLGRFLQLKRRGIEEVTIMWDGEPEALKSALEAAKLLRGIGLRVRIAILPLGKDPNEVPPQVVRQAFYQAEAYTPQLEIRWRLRNPYSTPRK